MIMFQNYYRINMDKDELFSMLVNKFDFHKRNDYECLWLLREIGYFNSDNPTGLELQYDMIDENFIPSEGSKKTAEEIKTFLQKNAVIIPPVSSISETSLSNGNGNTWEAVFKAIATPGALTDPVKVIFQKDKTFNEPITAGTVIGIDSDLSFKSLTAQKVIFFGSRVEASSITAKHVMFLNSDINISSINTNNIYISGGNLNSKLICTNNCLIYFYLMLHNGKHKGIKKDKSYLFNINEIPYIKEHTINNFKKLLYDIISSHNLTDKNIFCSQIDDFTGVKKGNINIEYLHNCDKTWFLSNIDNYIFSNKVTSNKNSYLATIKLAQDSSMLDYMKHPELLKWFNDQLVDIQDLFFRTKGNPFLEQIVKDIFYQNVTEADILKMENNLENIQKRFSS